MPQPLVWTESADVTICDMRKTGATWAEIGLVLGLSRNTVIERGRRLRSMPPDRPKIVRAKPAVSDDPNRPALPAGHWLTWGLLTDAAYPGPGSDE